MAHVNRFGFSFKLEDGRPSLSLSPVLLERSGFNLVVSISSPISEGAADPTKKIKSATVMAHFDTGASRTSIDKDLADFLGLTAVGQNRITTAAGEAIMPNYVVDISFPGTDLNSFSDLSIGSCDLPFEFKENGEIEISPNNFGLLIGRDIMSHWSVVWHGPSSTVFVSD